MAAFRHSLQLRQLQRLDPAAHKAATIALRGGFISMATRIVHEAMHAAFDRLTKPQPIIPAKAPKCRCDAYLRRKNDGAITLIPCRRIARYTLTIQNAGGAEPYQVQRCLSCRDELHAKTASGAIFEILDEVAR